MLCALVISAVLSGWWLTNVGNEGNLYSPGPGMIFGLIMSCFLYTNVKKIIIFTFSSIWIYLGAVVIALELDILGALGNESVNFILAGALGALCLNVMVDLFRGKWRWWWYVVTLIIGGIAGNYFVVLWNDSTMGFINSYLAWQLPVGFLLFLIDQTDG